MIRQLMILLNYAGIFLSNTYGYPQQSNEQRHGQPSWSHSIEPQLQEGQFAPPFPSNPTFRGEWSPPFKADPWLPNSHIRTPNPDHLRLQQQNPFGRSVPIPQLPLPRQQFGKKPCRHSKQCQKKRLAQELLKSCESGDRKSLAHLSPTVKQHNPLLSDGVAGFEELIEQHRAAGTTVNVVRIFEDGNYVFTHTQFIGQNSTKVGFNIFRFEGCKIVEHWDNLQNSEAKNPGGRSMVDGTTTLIDPELANENKKIVTSFVEQIFLKADFSVIPFFFDGEKFMRHNPHAVDGVSTFAKMLEDLTKQGIPTKYDKIYMVLGEGCFVLTVCEMNFPDMKFAVYDMWRVENRKIAEHWDVGATIPAKSEWRNSNSKF